MIRYHALDQCFSNSAGRFYIDDLIVACNYELLEYTGLTIGIKRRHVFEILNSRKVIRRNA